MNNSVTDSGGAINVAGGTLTVRNSSITGNSAGQSGGGILVRGYYDDRNPTLILENTLVKDNRAGVTGGGIAVTDHEINFSSVTVDNQSRIYDNSAAEAGDDFSYARDNNSNNETGNTITLDNISLAGINGIDGWYNDNEDDRFRDTDNPTVFTAYVDNNGNVAFYLKAAGLSTGNYDGNGGETGALPVVVKYGDTYTVSDDKPSRDGYTFKSWNTRSDGSGITLVAGDTYDGSDGWTLYAQWEEIKSDEEVTPSDDDTDPPADGTTPPADDTADEETPINPVTNDGSLSVSLRSYYPLSASCRKRARRR